MAPMAKSKALVSTWKGFVGSACSSTGEVMNACLSESNAFCAAEVHKREYFAGEGNKRLC